MTRVHLWSAAMSSIGAIAGTAVHRAALARSDHSAEPSCMDAIEGECYGWAQARDDIRTGLDREDIPPMSAAGIVVAALIVLASGGWLPC